MTQARLAFASFFFFFIVSPLNAALREGPQLRLKSPAKHELAAGPGSITGRVVNERGEPLAGIFVFAQDAVTGLFNSDATTDTDGRYTLTNFAAGPYHVNAFDGFRRHDNLYVDTWFPNVWDTDFHEKLAAATPVVVGTGEAVANFTLPFGGSFLVSLRDPSGIPIDVPTNFGCFGSTFVESTGRRIRVNGSCAGLDFNNGTYESYAAPLGRTFYIEGWPYGSSNYLPMYFNQKLTLATADPVLLSAKKQPVSITMGATGRLLNVSWSFATPPVGTIRSVNFFVLNADGSEVLRLDSTTTSTSYQFSGLPDGDYLVAVSVRVVNAGVTRTFLRYHRNAATFREAEVVTIRGQNQQVSVVMDSTPVPPTFRLDAVSPSSGTQGRTLALTVTGAGFQSGTTFAFGPGITVDNTTINSSSGGTVNVTVAPNAAEGFRTVIATQAAGGPTSSLANGFRVVSGVSLQPLISSIAPSCAPPAGGTEVTITGSGFQFGANVTFGGVASTGVTFVSATTIRAVTPAMALGPVTVVVTNPGGLSSTSTQAFRTGNAPEVAPQLAVPSATILAGSPFNISWIDAETVASFLVEVSTSPAFTTILQSFQVDGTVRSSTLLLEQPGSYFVRISADSGCGRKAGNAAPVTVAAARANVTVSALPRGMFQFGATPANSDAFTVTNFGGSPSTIALEARGDFYSITTTSLVLAPGQSQVVTVIPTAVQPTGVKEGMVLIRGTGTPPDLAVAIRLSAAPAVFGFVKPAPSSNRIDVAAPAGTAPGGSVDFTNSGTGTLTGFVVADVPWIITSREPVTIPPGGTVSVAFTIDRSKRPDAESPVGSVAGKISLVYSPGNPVSKLDGPRLPSEGEMTAFTPVGITDTVKPVVINGAVPAAGNVISYFIPGVGHVTSSSGTFISDLSLSNTRGAGAVNDIKLFFLPRGGLSNNAQTTSFGQLLPNQSFHLADVVRNVFGSNSQVGSLQIRTLDSARLALNASIFNVSNPKGTFGSVIPIVRSDRTIGPDGKLFITGLRRDAGGHTNFYLQETAGATSTVQIDFLDAAGVSLAQRVEVLSSFAFLQISSPVPEGGVSAVITNSVSSAGRVQAYATPLDRASGDFWAVADWAKQYNYSATEPVLIPIAGRLRGANNTDFRTDVSIFNIGPASGTGTLRYYPRGGTPVDRSIILPPRQTRVLNDVISDTFGLTTDSVGYLLFTPAEGSFSVTSRTYTIVAGSPGTFGTGVPAIGLGAGMRQGETQKFAGVEDVTLDTVRAARPATFRTNFGIIETAGEPVTVRATLRYTEARGAFAAVGVGTREFNLGPREFALVSNISRAILGESRDTNFGDLRNLQVDFEVISPTGRAMVFISATDNGTGDTILRLAEK